MIDWEQIEKQRIGLQADLDSKKSALARNQMGQFATPTLLARKILEHGKALLPAGEHIRFIDPAIGTGSFYSALCSVDKQNKICRAFGYEIDPHYGNPSRRLWVKFPLDIRLEDFTKAEPGATDLANLLICNPPYVRHHHIDADTKAELRYRTQKACGIKINGLSGLYCYFIGLSHKWMLPSAIAGWLVPSEFMCVNYGCQIKEYLLNKVTLIQIHRFDPENVQFDDALVSSAVVWFKNELPTKNHKAIFSFGGTLAKPEACRKVLISELRANSKWTRYPQSEAGQTKARVSLGDIFDIKRGLATGDNKFFILEREQIDNLCLPMDCFTPVLPSSRFLPEDEIKADEKGLPLIEKQLFLLNTQNSENEIEKLYPELKSYLDSGKIGEKSVASRYLCRSRSPWYAQENRPPAPIICTYMGRGRNGVKPFRFILNHSLATACNVFLMLYPKPLLADMIKDKPDILRAVWKYLNEIDPGKLLAHGRVYGGGLHKLEPKELRGFPADELLSQIPELKSSEKQS